MNLIEQLGGYEKAKSAQDWIEKNKPVHEWMKPILNAELLQYRRQNNIYEAGDIVKHDYSAPHEIFKIMEIVNNLALLDDGDWVLFEYIEHATDAEIEAGRRL